VVLREGGRQGGREGEGGENVSYLVFQIEGGREGGRGEIRSCRVFYSFFQH